MIKSDFDIVDNILSSEILPSTIHGQGLFATEDINALAILGLLDGQIVPWEDQFSEHFEWNAIDEKTLLIRPIRTKYSFVNHSRSPNLIIEYNPMRVTARRAIKKGEEFGLDYRLEPLSEKYLLGHGKTYL